MSSAVEKTRFRIAFDNMYGRKPQKMAGGGMKMDVGAQAPSHRAVAVRSTVPQQVSSSPAPVSVQSPASVPAQTAIQSKPLNGSMIDRVHRAKPGCSACGKKVV